MTHATQSVGSTHDVYLEYLNTIVKLSALRLGVRAAGDGMDWEDANGQDADDGQGLDWEDA